VPGECSGRLQKSVRKPSRRDYTRRSRATSPIGMNDYLRSPQAAKPQPLRDAPDPSYKRFRLGLKQANGAELWAKIVASGLIGSGPTRLSLVGERFGEG